MAALRKPRGTNSDNVAVRVRIPSPCRLFPVHFRLPYRVQDGRGREGWGWEDTSHGAGATGVDVTGVGWTTPAAAHPAK